MADGSATEPGKGPDLADFDVHGALELHVQLGVPMCLAERPVVVEDVTKRCAVLCLTVIQDVVQHVGGSGNMDAFLSDISSLLRQLAKSGKKAKGADSPGEFAPKIVEDIDLQRFYSGAHTPMVFTEKLAARLTDWSAEAEVALDNDAVRRICWKYYLKEKERVVTNADWLSPECNYRLFLIYNRLLLKEDTTELEVGQVNAFLMKMVQMLGFLWTTQLEYAAEGTSCVNFPEFVTLVTEYFQKLNLTMQLTCELIGDLMDLLVNGVLKKGYLTKKGHLRKNWKRRFFVLKTDSLHYYRDREQTDKKGVLAMNLNTKLINSKDCEDPKHPHKFVVTCGKKGVPFEIVADSQQEKHYWMQAVSKAIALYQLNSSLSRKEFEESMEGWRRTTYGVAAKTEAISVPVSGRSTSVMKRQVKERVAHVVMQNRTSMPPEESSHFPVEDHKLGESAPSGLTVGIVSPQRVADPYTPMHATLSASSSVGRLCDYEAMARNSTSSDSESEDDDRYINCTTPRNGSSGSQGAVRKARGSSTSSAGRRVGTVKEEAREEDTENWPYVKLDPKDEGAGVAKEEGQEKKENHGYINFGTQVADSVNVPVKDNLAANPDVRESYENWSKPSSSQQDDGTGTADMRLDLSDRGNRRKGSRGGGVREVAKRTVVEEVQLRERDISAASSDEDGSYIAPSEIASYPKPMPRKSLNSKKSTPISKESDLYLQI